MANPQQSEGGWTDVNAIGDAVSNLLAELRLMIILGRFPFMRPDAYNKEKDSPETQPCRVGIVVMFLAVNSQTVSKTISELKDFDGDFSA